MLAMDQSPKVPDVKPFKDKDTGEEGYCFGDLRFTGSEAYQRAMKAQKKAKAEFWSKNPRPLPKDEKSIKSKKNASKKMPKGR